MEQDFTHLVTKLVFQLAAILITAKLAGELCERYIKIPPVLGELTAGIAIGPFALGGIAIFGMDPLFGLGHSEGHSGAVPVSIELFSVSQIAAVVLHLRPLSAISR